GKDLSMNTIQIGQPYEFVEKQLSFEDTIAYQNGQSSYEFKLTKKDLKTQPLVKLSDDIFLQCYFDAIENKLSSVRILTANTLLLHAPYEIEYRGVLPEEPLLSDEDWVEIEEGMANQIFLLTNVKRNQYGKDLLKWDQDVTEVALMH